MVKPPKIYKDSLDLTTQDIDDYNSSFDLDTSNYFELDVLQYPGINSPFEENNQNITLDSYVFNNDFKSNIDLLKLDIEDLLKLEGITSINGKPIKFGNKNIRTWGKETSHHRRKDPHTGNASARDISIVGGTKEDYLKFRSILLANKNVRDWMLLKNWGIINEITPQILSQTKGTGNHFHFGPDQWARNTWRAWLDNPDVAITTSFRHYNNSLQLVNNNLKFAISLNNAYRKALSEKGLDPNYSYMLTALDANESSWGKSVKGNYNYGNVTTNGNDWHSLTGKRKWKDFKSLEDYVNYKIDFLSKNRYKFFLTFSSNSNVSVAMQTLANRGYDPGNPKYGIDIANTYKTLLKYLTDEKD